MPVTCVFSPRGGCTTGIKKSSTSPDMATPVGRRTSPSAVAMRTRAPKCVAVVSKRIGRLLNVNDTEPDPCIIPAARSLSSKTLLLLKSTHPETCACAAPFELAKTVMV